ncbi:MAG: glycosyltransferase family 2 protein [Oscillospiraceae bacterium]|jgi:glycosyltransferase involved in cell wall biosynthesis|nr:glycosyltransferase family 2 protein [Oscillospiraceae bacterium]
MGKNTLYIIIPCFNEEEALPLTAEVMRDKLRALTASGKIDADSRILLIDDGSRDRTWEIISGLSADGAEFCGLKLSRNRGTQNALCAGFEYARPRADAVVSTDADLQDDPDAIDRMVDAHRAGADVVYGVRSRRDKDTFAKRFTAEFFYKIMRLLGSESVFNHSDFRLLSRRALDAMSEYGEGDMFIRGITPLIGFKSAVVEYRRGERNAGTTKYSFAKLLALAMNGATSSGLKPVRLVSVTGGVLVLLSALYLIAGLVSIAFGAEFGLANVLLFSVWFLAGLTLAGVGIVGEYAGRAFMEAKRRPRYHIEAAVNLPEDRGGNEN